MVPWLVLVLLATILAWGYSDSLTPLAVYWQSPPYRQAWLVLLLAAIVLWARLRPMGPVSGRARWTGVLLLAVSLGARLLASHYGWLRAEMATFVPALASLWLVVGGWRALASGGPAIALLLLTFPLDWNSENNVLDRVQGLATRSSVFALQTLGVEAYREGNVIYIGGDQSGIVDSSSRIRLALVVVALAAATALVVRRPLWERLLIFLSGPVAALAVNVFRLTVSGLLRQWGSAWAADRVLRDPGAVMMLCMAALLVLLEYLVLSHLYREVRPAETPKTETGASP